MSCVSALPLRKGNDLREFDCPGPIRLNAKVATGVLNVTAEPGSTATVDVQPFEDNAASRDAADRTRVRVEVRLPEDSKLQLKLAAADARLTGRYGDCVVEGGSGDLELGHVAGWLRLHTASGDVHAERVDGQVLTRKSVREW